MTTTVSFLAVLPQYPSLGESIVFILFGFALVLVVLAALMSITSLFGMILRKKPQVAAAVAQPTTSEAQATTAAAMTDIAEEQRLIAVVSAAVYCSLGGPARIVSIRPSDSSGAWSSEGRRSIFQSHKIR